MPLPASTHSFKFPYYFLYKFSLHLGGILLVIYVAKSPRLVIRSPGFFSTIQLTKNVINALSPEFIFGKLLDELYYYKLRLTIFIELYFV